MWKSPGSVVPGKATTTRSSTAKFVAPQTMSRGSGSPTSTLQALIGFLNSVSSSISATRPTVSGPVTGPERDDLLDLVADPDQRRLEVVGRHVPTGGAG